MCLRAHLYHHPRTDFHFLTYSFSVKKQQSGPSGNDKKVSQSLSARNGITVLLCSLMQQLSYKKADGNGHYLSQKLFLYPPVSPVTTTTTGKVVFLHIYICATSTILRRKQCYLTDVLLQHAKVASAFSVWLLIDLSAFMQIITQQGTSPLK